jgi:hypothetical protein
MTAAPTERLSVAAERRRRSREEERRIRLSLQALIERELARNLRAAVEHDRRAAERRRRKREDHRSIANWVKVTQPRPRQTVSKFFPRRPHTSRLPQAD